MMNVVAVNHLIFSLFKISQNMKVIRLFALVSLIASSVFLDSCCTKEYCIGADDMDQIQFYNFTDNELDTVVVRRFNKNTGFARAIDSAISVTPNFYSTADFKVVRLVNKLTVDFDYQIVMSGTGMVFAISDFVVTRKSCNTGFMCNDSFNALESYKLNGQPGGSTSLSIRK